jgi:hypothetical protein
MAGSRRMSKKLQDTAYNYGAKTRSRKPVDWKARALKAEAELAKARALIAHVNTAHQPSSTVNETQAKAGTDSE